MCFEFFQGDELKRAAMGRFKIDWRSPIVIECGFPARDTNAPFVPGFQSGETPLRSRRNKIVSVQHGEIQKFLCYLHTHSVLSDVFRAGSAVPVSKKSSERVPATAFQFTSEDIVRHNYLNRYIESRELGIVKVGN